MPAPPSRLLLPLLPRRRLLRLLPVPLIAVVPVRVRFSTLAMAAREKVILDSTLSVPESIASVITSVMESTL